MAAKNSFVWYDLMTPDVAGAKKFYSAVAGWTTQKWEGGDYELLVTDLGLDDNGTSPEDAVTLAVGIEGELTGTLNPGEDGDYFILAVRAETDYQLNLESTHSVNVTSGSEDRFGQINFGTATAGGLLISANASAGTPGTAEFIAPATEEVLLRLAASGTASSSATIQYAISVIEVIPDEE